MSSQVERGTVRQMVHSIAYRAGVLEHILQEPVYGSKEVRSDELAHVQLLQRQIDDLRRYLNLPSTEPERKWIPVSEELPKEKGEYLVSYHPCHWNTVSEKVVVGMDTFRGKTTWAKMKYQKVIAWMPLPDWGDYE